MEESSGGDESSVVVPLPPCPPSCNDGEEEEESLGLDAAVNAALEEEMPLIVGGNVSGDTTEGAPPCNGRNYDNQCLNHCYFND